MSSFETQFLESQCYRKIWAAIHIICKTYDPSRDPYISKALVCFLNSLSKLLPSHEFRYNAQEFIRTHPIPTESCQKVFEWSYHFHSYISRIRKSQKQFTSHICFEEAKKLYDSDNITKDIWGRLIWFLLHYIASVLPLVLTNELTNAYYTMVMCFKSLLPCEICRYHLEQHLKSFPLEKWLSGRNSVFEWTVILHNSVNYSLDKKIVSLEEAKELYGLK
jgi:hypothetical protein